MDPSLFQFSVTEVFNTPKAMGVSDARVTTRSARQAGLLSPVEECTVNSRKLDLTHSFSVIPVVGSHLVKFITYRSKKL
jgi:hypothetical protein